MKLRSPRFWIAFVSAAAVLGLALVDVGRTSPGPLSAVHMLTPELDGGQSCSECHGGWLSSMGESCLECHEDVAVHIEEDRGLHGNLSSKVRKCALCHSEHHGERFPLVNVQSFVAAGIPDVKAFEHEFVGWTMYGNHLELECRECHADIRKTVLEEGDRRFMGLDRSCATCHEDVHEGAMMFECAQCHGQHDWEQLESLGHEEHLPLIGGHADLRCGKCHAKSFGKSLEVLASGAELKKRTCEDCHESPHQKVFVEGIASLVEMSASTSCVTCHAYEHVTFRDETIEVSDEQHACSGFLLEDPHDQASCEDCHYDPQLDFLKRYPGRGPDDCSSCHDDPHGGQFAEGPFSQNDCIACHDRHEFEPHVFDVEKHELAALVLDGSHLETECNDCHEVQEEEAPRVFRGTPAECESCHVDAHRNVFDRFALDMEPVEHGLCSHCHLTTEFSDVPEVLFDHGAWTRFTVLGAHAQDGCQICHERSEEPDRFGRTFGRVDELFGPAKGDAGCETCHVDPHDGEFNGPGKPRRFQQRAGCSRCHDQTSFRVLPQGFEHGRWTGFPLKGVHGEIGCSECHAPLALTTETGRTWDRAAGSACEACHADPHAGQFLKDGNTSCQRCHESTARFSLISFNHEYNSRFPLGEAHAEVACSACHSTFLHEGAEVVRYKPLGSECVDCHGTHDGPTLKRKGKKP